MLNTPSDRAIAANAMLHCALWSSTDEDSEPLDASYDPRDIAPATVAALTGDLFDFIDAEIADLIDLDASQVGHDFWLTRNHHGAGFWDRGLGEVGKRLTTAAQAFGEVTLYIGDDGWIYA
jgi:hypothetical protein